MRNHLAFFVNGERCTVPGADAFLTLAEYLRQRQRLTGTKVVCAEGDCGACSVLVGRPVPGESRLRFAVVDSCIAFLHQVDAAYVVTVEGLAAGGELHPVQMAMIDHFGSQCGYCTPGFVVTIAGLFEEAAAAADGESAAVDEARLRRGLSGNLCRCTGYVQILEAALAVADGGAPRLPVAVDETAITEELRALAGEAVEVRDGERVLYVPVTLGEASEWRARRPESLIVAGATDVGVLANKERIAPRAVLALGSRVPGFDAVERVDGVSMLGAGATWTAVLEAARRDLPELARLLELFGAPQIRNLATVGGNVVNASPIADSLPLLLVTGATLELASTSGVRQITVEEFLLGYKRVDLRPGEILARVAVPLPLAGETLRLYKMSKRRDLDISSVCAAVLLDLDGDRIERARVAFGGVAPTAIRVPPVERWLEDRPFDEATMRRAGELAGGAVSPISDVRGRADYRRRLVENALAKVWFDVGDVQSAELQPSTSTVRW